MNDGEGLLLVEDDAATRELLSLLLARDGWQVQGAESGEDALAWLGTASDAPGVVLCDQRLPGICGSALAQALQATLSDRFRSHETVLLAMTATADGTLPHGYARILLKPFPAASVRTAMSTSKQSHAATGLQSPTTGDLSGESMPVVDEITLIHLRRAMPDRQLREMFKFAIADAENRMDRMDRFSKSGEQWDFTREAHSLKGSFGVIGAAALRSLADDAERSSCDAESFGSISEKKVQSLRNGLQQLRLMLVTLFPE